MSVDYTTAAKDLRMTAIRDHFNNGTLVLLTAADATLSTHTFAASSGTVTGGVWTLTMVNDTVQATGTGTAAKAEIRESGGTADITGLTVGTSGTDIVIGDTAINTGQDVTMSSGQITHAP